MTIYFNKIIELIRREPEISPEKVLLILLNLHRRCILRVFNKDQSEENPIGGNFFAHAHPAIQDSIEEDRSANSTTFSTLSYLITELNGTVAEYFNSIDLRCISVNNQFARLCQAFLSFYPEYIPAINKNFISHFKPLAYINDPQAIFDEFIKRFEVKTDAKWAEFVNEVFINFVESINLKSYIKKSSLKQAIPIIIKFNYDSYSDAYIKGTNTLLEMFYDVYPQAFRSIMFESLCTYPVHEIIEWFLRKNTDSNYSNILLENLLNRNYACSFEDFSDDVINFSGAQIRMITDKLLIKLKQVIHLSDSEERLSIANSFIYLVEDYSGKAIEYLFQKLIFLLRDDFYKPFIINLFADFESLPRDGQLQELCDLLLINMQKAELNYTPANVKLLINIAEIFIKMDCEQLALFQSPVWMIQKLILFHQHYEIAAESYIVPKLIFKFATSPAYNKKIDFLSRYIKEVIECGSEDESKHIPYYEQKETLVLNLAVSQINNSNSNVYHHLPFQLFSSKDFSLVRKLNSSVIELFHLMSDDKIIKFIHGFSEYSFARGEYFISAKLIHLTYAISTLGDDSLKQLFIDNFFDTLAECNTNLCRDVSYLLDFLKHRLGFSDLFSLLINRLKQNRRSIGLVEIIFFALIINRLPSNAQLPSAILVSKLDEISCDTGARLLNISSFQDLEWTRSMRHPYPDLAGTLNIFYAMKIISLSLNEINEIVEKIIENIHIKEYEDLLLVLISQSVSIKNLDLSVSIQKIITDKMVVKLDNADPYFLRVMIRIISSSNLKFVLSDRLTHAALESIWDSPLTGNDLVEYLKAFLNCFAITFTSVSFIRCVDNIVEMLVKHSATISSFAQLNSVFATLATIPSKSCLAYLFKIFRQLLENKDQHAAHAGALFAIRCMLPINKEVADTLLDTYLILFLNHENDEMRELAYRVFEASKGKFPMHVHQMLENLAWESIGSAKPWEPRFNERLIALAFNIHSPEQSLEIKRFYMLAFSKYQEVKHPVSLSLLKTLTRCHTEFNAQLAQRDRNLAATTENVMTDKVSSTKKRKGG